MMGKNNKLITVITVTKGRKKFLERAIKTVKNQTIACEIHHFIYIDDCLETLDFLETNYSNDNNISWYFYKRKEGDVSGPSLLARLRNDAVRKSCGEWLAYLDDDNEFEPEHIQKLYEFAVKNRYIAVHSNVQVYNRDNTPYLFNENIWPWARSEKAKAKYNFMLEMGLIEKNSNIRKYQYGIVIDTNVWLVKRGVWEKCAISDNFSDDDWENNLAEDDKLMMSMLFNNIPVHSNGEATVIYYLGGYSNEFTGKTEGTIVWERV